MGNFCSKCGAETGDLQYCPKCGCPVNGETNNGTAAQPQMQETQKVGISGGRIAAMGIVGGVFLLLGVGLVITEPVSGIMILLSGIFLEILLFSARANKEKDMLGRIIKKPFKPGQIAAIILSSIFCLVFFVAGFAMQQPETENVPKQQDTENIPQQKKQDVSTAAPDATKKPSTKKQAPTVKTIAPGEVITTDKAEITINKIEFSYDVLPDDTSSFYTHYAAESGKVYIHIDASVKNLQKQDLSCTDIMSVTANYNQGYTYKSYPIPEDSTTGFTYANITSIKPLEKRGVRFLINCPQEVEQSSNSLILTFNVGTEKYEYTMR